MIASLLVFSAFAVLMWPILYRVGLKHGLVDRRIAIFRATVGDLSQARRQIEQRGIAHADCGGGLWGRWDRKTARRLASGDQKYAPGRYVDVDVQERTCDQCGYVERRELR